MKQITPTFNDMVDFHEGDSKRPETRSNEFQQNADDLAVSGGYRIWHTIHRIANTYNAQRHALSTVTKSRTMN